MKEILEAVSAGIANGSAKQKEKKATAIVQAFVDRVLSCSTLREVDKQVVKSKLYSDGKI
jgi:hypothetical protein